MANGYITIGTELKTDKFDKQIASLERKMEQEEKKKIELNFDVKEQEFIQAKKQYDELNQKVDQYKRKLETLKDMPRIAKEQGQEIKPLWKYLEELQSAKSSYGKAIEDLQKQEGVLYKITNEYNSQKSKIDEINAKISEYKQKAESIRFNKQQAEIEQVKQGFDKVGNSIQSAVRQAGRMVLSIIGIRTGLAMLRSASSTLAGYDEQYASNLEYIRFALAEMIAPVLRYIVELVATILQYINAIVSAWFGINLFSNASAKNFQKMKAGAGGTAKAVKEIKKQLAGFDEINMLSDMSSGGGGGGGGGGISPAFDLGSNVPIPKWLQWIIDNKDLILAILAGITAGIVALKLGLGGIKALGIGLMITGIIKLIKDVIKFIKDPSWKNFSNILIDVSLIIAGIALITGNWTLALIALGVAVAGVVIKLFTQKNGILSVKDAEEKLKQATEDLQSANDAYINSVDKAEETLKKLKDAEEQTGLSGEELNSMVEQGILDYKDMTAQQREVYKAYKENEKAQKELKESTEKLEKAKQEEKKASWENKLAVMAEKGEFKEYKKAVVDAFNSGELSADEARELIGKAMTGISEDSWGTFVEDLPNDIKTGLDPTEYYSWADRFAYWWNHTFIGSLIKDLRLAITATGNFSLGGGGGGGASYSGGRALGAIYFPPKMKLWTGGIINMPGRGVPLGSNIGGERGAEGVIPLTQNQAMETLGYEIGKNVTVNLTNITEMNGRIIGRELKKIRNQQDFAYNT